MVCLLNPLLADEPEDPIQQNAPIVPYLNGTKDLEKLKFKGALRWFNTTIQDFPTSEFALKASQLQLMVLMAHELGYLRLQKLWVDGVQNITEHTPQDEKKVRDLYQQTIERYRSQLNDVQSELLSRTKAQWGFTQHPTDKEFIFSLDLQDINLTETRKKVSDGMSLTPQEIEALETDTMVLNFIGILQDVFPGTQFNKNQLNPVASEMDTISFYFDLAVRMNAVAEARSKETSKLSEAIPFHREALRAFQKIIALTEKDKYHPKRAEVEEKIAATQKTLAKLESNPTTSKAKSKKPPKL